MPKILEEKHIYVVYCEESAMTKISVSKNVERSLKTLKFDTGYTLDLRYVSPLRLDSVERKRDIHRLFFKEKSLGDWFFLSEEQIGDLIDTLLSEENLEGV